MKLNELKPNEGATHHGKRVGRGTSSGHGKTATRGHKGQKSRSGGLKNPARFEGGRSTLLMRLPKRGMRGQVPGEIARVHYQIVNLDALMRRFPEGGELTPKLLAEAGLVRKASQPIKLLGRGEVSGSYTLKVHAVSATAEGKIKAANGMVVLLGKQEV